MGNTVLLTGCSSGVGRATARAFLADGWDVYATARDPSELSDLEEAGAATMKLDVTSDADVDRVVERIVEERGRIDCLVNIAGYGQMGPLEDLSVERVRAQYDVNLFGPHRLMRAVLPHMRQRRSGRIINVTSVTDRFPIAGSSAYSGSKAALSTASRALSQEVRDHGVDVVLVGPTTVATDFYDRVRDELVDVDHDAAYVDLYEVLELLHTVKAGGLGIASPETVAETILEAANSDDPRWRYDVGWPAKAGAVIAALLPESWRTPAMYAAVRISASKPGKLFLQWWFSRHHRASEYQKR